MLERCWNLIKLSRRHKRLLDHTFQLPQSARTERPGRWSTAGVHQGLFDQSGFSTTRISGKLSKTDKSVYNPDLIIDLFSLDPRVPETERWVGVRR